MVNVWSMTKKYLCFKNPFYAKNAIFSKIMSQLKDFFGVIQAPYISKHISRNGKATIKASQQNIFYFGAKNPFFLKKWWHHQKKVIVLNMYIGTNVLVYERWLVLKVRSTAGRPAGPTLSPFHTHIACACESNMNLFLHQNVNVQTCET